jgi:hypothetical protein
MEWANKPFDYLSKDILDKTDNCGQYEAILAEALEAYNKCPYQLVLSRPLPPIRK